MLADFTCDNNPVEKLQANLLKELKDKYTNLAFYNLTKVSNLIDGVQIQNLAAKINSRQQITPNSNSNSV